MHYPNQMDRIRLIATDVHNDETGSVDAHTGKVIATEPRVLDYSADWDIGNTIQRFRSATTHLNNRLDTYNLCDSSRYTSGGPGIHTHGDLNA